MSELDDLEEINIWPDRVLTKRIAPNTRRALRHMQLRAREKHSIKRLQNSSIKNRKITPAQRIAIRTDPRPTETISVEYGISDDYVRDIRQGKFG